MSSLWVMDHFFQISMIGPPETDDARGVCRARLCRWGHLANHVGHHGDRRDLPPSGVLLKTVTTLDVLSGGRAWLGIGAAWNEEEHRGLGVPYPGRRSASSGSRRRCSLAHQMWSDDDRPFEGKHYQLERPLNSPQAIAQPHPPILIGGGGEKKTLRLVAQYADACNIFDMGSGGGAGQVRRHPRPLRGRRARLRRHREDRADPAGLRERRPTTRSSSGSDASGRSAPTTSSSATPPRRASRSRATSTGYPALLRQLNPPGMSATSRGRDAIVVGAGPRRPRRGDRADRAGRTSSSSTRSRGPTSAARRTGRSAACSSSTRPEQRRMGVKDSVELAWQDWLGTAGFDRPEDHWPGLWARAYVDFAAGEKRAWLHAQGMRWFPVVGWAERGDGRAGGHGNSVPRFHVTWGTGPGVVEPFVRKAIEAERDRSAAFAFRHRVDELVVDGRGRHRRARRRARQRPESRGASDQPRRRRGLRSRAPRPSSSPPAGSAATTTWSARAGRPGSARRRTTW